MGIILALGRFHRRCRLNTVLPKAGLNGFDWTFVKGSTFVLRLNFCAKNPRLRQYPKRSAKEEQEKMKNKNER